MLHQHLFGRKASQELVNVFGCALSYQKLACRDVEKRESYGLYAKVNGRQKVIFTCVEHVVGHGYAWRYQFGNAALNEFLS